MVCQCDNNRWGKTSTKRSRNCSKTGLTPSTKIATSTKQDTSQVLVQAHESLYINHIALSVPPLLPQHPPSNVSIISGHNYSTLPPYTTQSTLVLSTVCQQTSLLLPPSPLPQGMVYNMPQSDQQCVLYIKSNQNT